MKWGDLALNTKVALSLGALLLVICAMAAVFMYTLQGLAKDVEVSGKAQAMGKTMALREVDHLKWINKLQGYVYNEKEASLDIQEDPSKCAFGQWYYGEGRKQAEADFPVLKEELAKIDAAHAALHQSAGAIRKLKQSGDAAGAEHYFEQVSVANMSAVQASLMAIDKLLQHEQERILVQFESSSLRARVVTLASGALGAVLALLMILVISRSITRPIMGLAGFADRVAQGDYSARSQIARKDEIGSLAASFDVMVGNMVSTINLADEKAREAGEQSEKAREAMQEAEAARLEAESATRRGMQEAAFRLEAIVQATASSCETLREAVQLASQGAEEQLKYATETASAMTEMTGAILEVANNSGAAAASADEASKNADKGSELVTQTIHSIAEVNEKSGMMSLSLSQLGEQAQGIGQVMNVITDIADQTNLLALNAAIEAARAGEAGRGFAVVADEVRKLAEKTMQATTEVGSVIKALQQSVDDNLSAMEASSHSVEESTNLAQEAGNSLKAILDISGITAAQVSAIATASEQQSATSEEINKGTEEINRLAERNAELMVRSGETLDQLVSLTRQISGLVEELKAA